MCICVCICANNMQILGFGGVGGVRSGGGIPLGGEGGGVGVRGPGSYIHITYIYIMYLYMVCMCVFTGSVSSQVNAIYNSMCIYIYIIRS